jgi:hypothetical protein
MHSTIKLHLDREEYAPIARLAEELRVPPEAVVYAAVNRLMPHTAAAATRREIVDLHTGRREGLPAWADDARGVHIYESKEDE